MLELGQLDRIAGEPKMPRGAELAIAADEALEPPPEPPRPLGERQLGERAPLPADAPIVDARSLATAPTALQKHTRYAP
jgi:hypothetical protein